MQLSCVSLFDGMSCARLALEEEGFEVVNYFASEIDKYAIQVSKDNWHDVKHIGDVRNVSGLTLPKIDLLLGGPPCQGFSFAGKQLNFEDPRSKLFFEFVRILKELREENPAIYFLLENVKMEKESRDIISEFLGVQPIEINSGLVSAQNRKRLYWTNIPFFGQPKECGLVIRDILETGVVEHLSEKEYMYMLRDSGKWAGGKSRIDSYHNDLDGKALCLTANMYKGVPYGIIKRPETSCVQIGTASDRQGYDSNKRIYSVDGKSPALISNSNGGSRGVLIPDVDEKYYLTEEQLSKLIAENGSKEKDIKILFHREGYRRNLQVYDIDGKTEVLDSQGGGGRFPSVAIPEEFYLTPEQVERGYHQAEGKTWRSGNKMGNMDFPNNPNKKAKTLCIVGTKGGRETNHIHDGFYYRRLTPVECERLQTVRDNYTAAVSNTQRYKKLGNGWNIKTIRHLIRPIKFAKLFE